MADQRKLWIKSNYTADRTSAVTIGVGERALRTFSHTGAHDYAQAVLAYARRAEYTAAMFRQLTETLGVAHQQAREIVQGILMALPPIPEQPTAPLVWKLAVGTNVVRAVPQAPKGTLLVELHGSRLGRWDVPAARDHAMQVLEAAESVDLDTAYLHFLSTTQLEPGKAHAVVADVANYRR